MTHVSPSVLWTFGCRADALNESELVHVLNCVDCRQLLEGIEEALDEIAEEQGDQAIN